MKYTFVKPRYIKEAFDVFNIDQAKHVVLTSDPNNPNKFKQETQFFIDKVKELNLITANTLVLDFGCGMGRVSRELIREFKCKVVGVDISPSMQAQAVEYVSNSELFTTYDSYSVPSSVDVAISTFVLQHVERPTDEIRNLYDVIKPGGYLILVNEKHRFVPSNIDKDNYVVWNDDGVDIHAEVASLFKPIASVQYMKSQVDIVLYQK